MAVTVCNVKVVLDHPEPSAAVAKPTQCDEAKTVALTTPIGSAR